MTNAVFLDRDGVINKIVYFPEHGILDSPLNPTQFKLIRGAAEAIANFNQMGLKVIVVSNQPAIAKGKMTEAVFERIQMKMHALLEEKGARLDGEYYCFHHPKAKKKEYKVKCDCRKPKSGLLLKAAKEHNLDLSQCFMVGDGVTDIKAGSTVGCKSILVGDLKCDLCRLMEYLDVKPHFIAANLFEASKIIEKEVQKTWKYSLIPQV
jgi:D-glycero-D-manno-heptose 1,7-bisphosphate phosphatase